MTAQRLIDTCAALARQQYPDDAAGRAECEIQLLRTKVMELVRRSETTPAPRGYRCPDCGTRFAHEQLCACGAETVPVETRAEAAHG